MANKIIYTNSDGGVSIVTPASGVSANSALAAKTVPNGTAYSIVSDSTIPTDRTFRSAWTKTNDTISINLIKAKDIAINIVRSVALQAIAKSEEQTSLGETPTHQVDAIRSAHSLVKTEINSGTTDSEIKSKMTSFNSTYSV